MNVTGYNSNIKQHIKIKFNKEFCYRINFFMRLYALSERIIHDKIREWQLFTNITENNQLNCY